MAWQHISLEVVLKGFKKCCISTAVYGTDDDMLWNCIKEDENINPLNAKLNAICESQLAELFCGVFKFCT